MIRVTYIFKDTILQDEFEVIYLKNGYLKTNNRIASFNINIVKKIEKQARDLTLEECEKLGLEPWYYTNDRLICVRKKVGLIDETLELDDYIDITQLVKGENGNEN